MPTTKKGHRRLGHRAMMGAVLALAVTWSAFGATAADAAAFTWFNGSSKAETWQSKGLYAATYSKHTTTTWSDDGALAVQSIPKLGTASGPSKITTTFSKRQGTFKCKWSWYGKTGNGPLKCTFA
ncbi:hypothetical protein [Curtobacterium poinsettiae]|uniref:hypothetical protein n=1 Tax=Curtobacterium poinsettiae TaxID=159612 RepID=UPI0021C649AE|nr:hypothetical protein [Curtobacterium flaccumfaciens]MCU0116173.1 hypothetical protein [Curtobacterium flaccumfaciens]